MKFNQVQRGFEEFSHLNFRAPTTGNSQVCYTNILPGTIYG